MTQRNQPLRGKTVGQASATATSSKASIRVAVESSVSEPPVVFASDDRPKLQTKHLRIGYFIFEGQDQIDFTGPFEVFSRIPNTTIEVVAKNMSPVRDVKGLVLTPTTTIAEMQPVDVLAVSGGLGQQALMDDAEVISLIARHAASDSVVFSVCTGALLCGAAGVLQGRRATTHWAAWDLLHYYGAEPTRARVVVDRNYVSCAGVTAGLDGALLLASLLRGQKVAEEIQLDIEYAPEPLFHSGTPVSATPEVVEAFFRNYGANKQSREAEAKRFAEKWKVSVP